MLSKSGRPIHIKICDLYIAYANQHETEGTNVGRYTKVDLSCFRIEFEFIPPSLRFSRSHVRLKSEKTLECAFVHFPVDLSPMFIPLSQSHTLVCVDLLTYLIAKLK